MLGLEARINGFLNYMKAQRNFSAGSKTKSDSELQGNDLIVMVGSKKDDAKLSAEDKGNDTTVADHFDFKPLKDGDGKYYVAENEAEAIKVGKEVTGKDDGMFKVTSWDQLNKKDPECPTAKATPEEAKPASTEDKPKEEPKPEGNPEEDKPKGEAKPD